MRIIACCFVCLALQTMSTRSTAQIVNIESARMQSDTTGWMGGAGADMAITQSVQRVFLLDFDAHLQYKTDKNLWLILGDYGFLTGGGQKYVYNSFGHIRFNRKLNSYLRWEVFTQVQNNLVTQIDSRYLLGTGPRFKILSNKIIRLYAATLLMYERERERTKPPVLHKDLRSSSYVSFTITPNANIEIICTSFYQPLIKKIGDYRILNQASLKVKASKRFALSLKWNYLYDRFPAGTAPKTTYSFATGGDFNF
jgi:hypothetical protein